jgi:hypothetical protein
MGRGTSGSGAETPGKPLLRGYQAVIVEAARNAVADGAGTVMLAAEIASRQHGLITRAQATEVGFSTSAIKRRVRSGHWDRLHSGVYCVAGAPKTRARDILEACFAVGPDAVASFFTAGELHHLHEVWPRETIHVTVPHALRCSVAGVRVHRSRQLGPRDVTVVDGIPVTTAARTAIDLSPTLPKPKLELTAMDAVRRKLLDTQAFRKRVLRACWLGRKGGLRKLRPILRGQAFGEFHESVHEARILQAVLESGLPKPVTGVRVVVGDTSLGEADMFFVRSRVALECDGKRYHGTDSAKARDDEKTRLFAAAGILLVRAGWKDGGERKAEFIAGLANVIADRTTQFAGRSLAADGIELEASAGRAQYELDKARGRGPAAFID